MYQCKVRRHKVPISHLDPLYNISPLEAQLVSKQQQ